MPVYQPVRGVIDFVPADSGESQVNGGEAHSEIRRAERQLRWSAEKVDALPSASGWPWMAGQPRVGRLLLLRSTAATRALVASAPAMFRAAYPGRTSEAVASRTGGQPGWPGAAIVWVDVRGTASRLLGGTPRGIPVGL